MRQEKAAKPRGGLLNTIGAMAFFVGVLLSIVGGIFSQDNSTIVLILVILGIIIGLFNISAKETAWARPGRNSGLHRHLRGPGGHHQCGESGMTVSPARIRSVSAFSSLGLPPACGG